MGDEKGDTLAVVDAEVETQIAPTSQGIQIERLFELAIDKGIDVQGLEKLVTLHERIADRSARQEFMTAKAEFKNRCPAIPRTGTVRMTTKSGTRIEFKFPPIEEIAKVVDPILSELGFDYHWDSSDDSSVMVVTCVLTHIGGHSESAKSSTPIKSLTPMSDQQKFSAAEQQARRRSLINVLGLTSCDPDNDAADAETITAKQVADLAALIDEVKVDESRFLKFLGVDRLEHILTTAYDGAIQAIEQKRRQT